MADPAFWISGDEFVLPDLQYPSDDLGSEDNRMMGEIVHQRHGIILGRRTWADILRWHLVFRALESDVVDNFIPYYEAREFYLWPTGVSTNQIEVRWIQSGWNPKSLRGGYFDLEFDIEEKLG